MVYDPLGIGEINHYAFPLLIVLFLGEYNPKILKVTFPVASSFTIAHIDVYKRQGFLPLGLPENHKFWAGSAKQWTSLKAWMGKDIDSDMYISCRLYTSRCV